MSWVMETDPRCWPRSAVGRGSGLDPGDGPVSVICDPNRAAADRDRAGFGTDLDRRPFDLAAPDVDLPHRVVLAVGDPDGAGAAVDAAGMPLDFDPFDDLERERVELGDEARAAARDPDVAAGHGEAGRTAPDPDRVAGGKRRRRDP